MSLLSFFSSRSKRKPVNINNLCVNKSISDGDIELTRKVFKSLDNYIYGLELFPFSGKSKLQKLLRCEKQLDMARAELLVVAFRYFSSVALGANFNRNSGSLAATCIVDYIESLKIDFSNSSFNSAADFFTRRNSDYVQFFDAFLSNDFYQYNNSLVWLESIIRFRLLQDIGKNEVNEIYFTEYNAINRFTFSMYFPKVMFTPYKNDINSYFR